MSDKLSDLFHVITDGGVAALHPPQPDIPVFVGPSTADELNTIKPGLAPIACLRVDDVRFHFDSSFVGPQANKELQLLAQLRKDSPGILASVFGHADPVGDDNYNKQLSGRRSAAVYALLTRKVEIWEDIYSQKGVFTNPVVGDKWGISSVQVMLTTLGFYSGPINGSLDGDTRAAVKAFQSSPAGAGLNPDGDPGKNTRAKLFPAYMDAICTDARNVPFQMATTEFLAGGADKNGKGDYQGCGEFNPVLIFSQAENAAFASSPNHEERDKENQPNRRVLLFMFRPNSQISPAKWPCPRVKEGVQGCRARFFSDGEKRRSSQALRREFKNTKDTFACRFYDRLAVESPCEVGPPLHVNLLRVHLKLVWKDPDPAAPPHVFPQDFPVVVVFGDGTTDNKKVGADGKLDFDVERSKRSFTLNFDFSEKQYLATATAATTGPGPERLVAESALKSVVDDHYRFFGLPLNSGGRWEMADWDWTAQDIGTVGGAPIFNNNQFEHLEDVSVDVGTETAPVKLLLDPHWQYLRFEYFDRFFGLTSHSGNRISIPSIVLEGFRKDPGAATPPPDTRSNWTVNDADTQKMCQCLPWVLRRKPDKSPDPAPDQNVQIQFRMLPGTFIQAVDGATRNLITVGGASSGSDPGLNAGASSNVNPMVPNADRLKLYDLPPRWKARKYFARLAAGGDNFFETLTAAQIQDSANNDPAKMLTFSLDDIVLCQLPSGGGALAPINWNPANDRAAIFANNFQNGPNASDVGPFKPDVPPSSPSGNNQSYFSEQVQMLKTTNYISDYPNWTRLVIARGNLFDTFDQRTPDASGQAVGARAGVMWVAGTGPFPGVVAGGTNNPAPGGIPVPGSPGTSFTTRPAITRSPNPAAQNTFFAIQPFYDHHHDKDASTPQFLTGDQTIGRTDMSLLRCCDVEGDVEVAVNLHYLRIHFDYTTGSPGMPATTLTTPAKQQTFESSVCQKVAARWNGGDANNSTQAIMKPQDGTTKLKLRALWFLQSLPLNISHFNMRVFGIPAPPGISNRAFMQGANGDSQIPENGNQPDASGQFVTAHESGHGDSMNDEYNERWAGASYYQKSIFSMSPGNHLEMDGGFVDFVTNAFNPAGASIMQTNIEPRPRHFWHGAEWTAVLTQIPLQVEQGPFNNFPFKLPQHPKRPNYTFNNFVLARQPPNRATPASLTGTRGRFDVFLFPLGEESYSRQKLPSQISNPLPPGPQPDHYDGMIVVVVKMRVSFANAIAGMAPPAVHIAIHNLLANMTAAIESNFNDLWFARGTLAGSALQPVTFNSCLIYFSPRFVVPDFSGDATLASLMGLLPPPPPQATQFTTIANSIEQAHDVHFLVDVRPSGAASWDDAHKYTTQKGTSGIGHLILPLNQPMGAIFPNFFADMIGIAGGAINQAASYLPIVRQVIPSGTVHHV